MKTITLICSHCQKSFDKNVNEYNRGRRNNQKNNFCSRTCSASHTLNQKTCFSVIRNCLWCQKEFESSNHKRYRKCCSETCSKKYSVSKRTETWQENLKKDPIKWYEYRKKIIDGTKKHHEYNKLHKTEILLSKDFNDIGWDYKRKRILIEQNNKCGHCGLSEWRNNPLTLDIDHVDGNNRNNLRENLIALCPNCHSITPTWRGRNKSSCKWVSDELAIDALKTEPSIRQALIKCGLAPKGGNYKRFSRLQINLSR